MAKRKKNKIKWWVVVACVIVIPLVALGWAYIWASAEFQGEDVRIFIPSQSTDSAISDTLTTHLGNDFGRRVFRLWKLQRGNPNIAYGSYVVKTGETALALSRRIKQGRQTPLKLTINNIRTMQQLAKAVERKMNFSAESFLEACDSLLPESGFTRHTYPAAFLPDTYEFYWTQNQYEVVKRLSRVRNAFWNDERRAQASALGLSPVQVATLASIVEEETAKTDEKPRVARLYLNRLKKGMRLQADPTVKFAVGDFSLRRILGKHLDTESPYNTYLNPGLPPGPIRIPTRATIEAVLSAPEHPYLYMCAKEDFSGYHNFASDYDTHKANARRYQAALNARGIK